jgi:hypothetical protein
MAVGQQRVLDGGVLAYTSRLSTPVLAGKEVRTEPATVRPYLLGSLAALSVGAAAVHFAVVFEHFTEYALYGVFFLIISWAQVIWPAVLLAAVATLAVAGHRRERHRYRGVRGVAHCRPPVRS